MDLVEEKDDRNLEESRILEKTCNKASRENDGCAEMMVVSTFLFISVSDQLFTINRNR